jgi:hypothetical protein
VERGAASPTDTEALVALSANEALPAVSRDQASLGLSRVLEAAGDTEGAVRAVEELMKRHGGETGFEAHGAAVRRLRQLVSGSEEAPPSFAHHMEVVAPVTKALSPFFPENADGGVLMDVVSVGGPQGQGDPNGIFNLSRAKRELAEAACSVCDVDVRVQRSHSRVDDWTALPSSTGDSRPDMPNADRSLVVVYFDLVENRVPARYDAYLAVSSAETVARLERGEAFIAVRQRQGKKPVVLLAAPRTGQLDHVEAAFAALETLPTEPLRVEVPAKLQPHEIQSVVRSRFRHFRACYEALLATDPKAAGSVTAKFEIDEEGMPRRVATASTFPEAKMDRCLAEQLGQMRFPPSRATVQVTYPIVFSP